MSAVITDQLNASIQKGVFAVLCHEQPLCVLDLLQNIERFNPGSRVLLYDASPDAYITKFIKSKKLDFVELISNRKPLKWGSLLEFAVASIASLGDCTEKFITFVDSDQLFINKGFSAFLNDAIGDFDEIGVLSVLPVLHGPDSSILSVRDMHADLHHWLPYLSRFSDWRSSFVRWTFWPGTVMGMNAAKEVALELRKRDFIEVFSKSHTWATEECILPTISKLLGFREVADPSDRRWCRPNTPWKVSDFHQARQARNCFLMHPINRIPNDALRIEIGAREW